MSRIVNVPDEVYDEAVRIAGEQHVAVEDFIAANWSTSWRLEIGWRGVARGQANASFSGLWIRLPT